ncbi:MAG: hypothetical protein IE909_01835 [Campylobacterales bacterium]|nr:hypothetical protein [Campylobacterales bacterium]
MQVQKNIKKELQLAENSKLAAMGMMIGNIIHQWKQPLSSILAIASLIQIKLEIGSKIDDLELLDHMKSINNTVQRLGQITEIFRNFLKEKKTLSTIVLQNRVQEALVISGTILKDKKIELRTDLQLHNPIEVTIVTVEDNAGGISEDLLPNIFDEYFTTKSDDRGTGLGLYMSKKIVVESFKGKLEVSNTPYGAKFSLFIPLIQ